MIWGSMKSNHLVGVRTDAIFRHFIELDNYDPSEDIAGGSELYG